MITGMNAQLQEFLPIGTTDYRKSGIEIGRLRHEFHPKTKAGRAYALIEKALSLSMTLNSQQSKLLPEDSAVLSFDGLKLLYMLEAF